jgi:uncharacterized RDD family membrane protein YckC
MTTDEATSPESPDVEPHAAGNPPPPPSPEAPVAGEMAPVGKRVLAFIIDGLIAMACSIVPIVGPLAGMAYGLTRDSLPFLDGQSIGKKALKLRAVHAETGLPLTNDWGPSLIRNIVLWIPFFALVELIVLITNDENRRLGDQWGKTKVILEG